MCVTQSLYYVWGLKQQVCIQSKLKIHIRIIDKALYLIGVYNVYVCGCRVHVIIIALIKPYRRSTYVKGICN